MLQTLSRAVVTDNTDAKEVMIIQIQGRAKGGGRMKFGTVGDRVSASVKAAAPNGVIKKGDVVHAVIVRTKKEIKRKDGSYIRFDDNAVVIIDENDKPKGTRVIGPVAREIRDEFQKIVSLAPEVL